MSKELERLRQLKRCPKLEELYEVDELCAYYNLIVEWNKKFNLTAVTKREEVYLKHFLDSLVPLHLFEKTARVLDIGSGAGLPAIVLKLFLPDAEFLLIDSVNKKVTFLNHVIATLGLKKIRAQHTRIEDLRERSFDIATARAVAPLSTLAEYALPFLKIGGRLVAYKGPNPQIDQSTRAISLLGGKISTIFSTTISSNMENNVSDNPHSNADSSADSSADGNAGSNVDSSADGNAGSNVGSSTDGNAGSNVGSDVELERNIVVIEKVVLTPSGYPRRQNKPRTEPL